MKRYLSIVLTMFVCIVCNAQTIESASSAVKNMGVGWNLGNTLDAHVQKVNNPDNASYWNCQDLNSETCWGQPYATSELFAMMKNAGFGAIRIPVTWYNHMDKNGKVDVQWMKRVHTVVDYAINNGLYCIINVHHDTGADNTNLKTWIKADETSYQNNKARFEYLWKQIAEEFKDYDGHLLFEGYNEMLDTKSSWCYASMNATGGYDASMATSAYNAINDYAQSFVNTVRETGGNNTTRNLIVTTYAAASGTGTWNSHLQDPLKTLKIPTDVTTDHIIFEVHSYPELVKTIGGVATSKTIAEIKSEIDSMISYLKTHLISKGAPVIIGEWGTSNVDAGSGKTDYDLRRSLMLDFVAYYVQKTKAENIGTFYWMGLTDGLMRSVPAFNQADLAERIVKTYRGRNFNGVFPTADNLESFLCFEGNKLLNWGDGITINSQILKDMGENVTLELKYSRVNTSDAIQFYLGDWSEKVSFKVDTKTYSGDFVPHTHYGMSAGTTFTTTFTFDKTNYTKLASKGLVIHGTNVRLTKAMLYNPNAGGEVGITDVQTSPSANGMTYNLSGQRINNPSDGIYIIDGKKVIVKNKK